MRTRLGAFIRASREAAGLTQDELGARVGVPRNTIGRWERGETAPSLLHLPALCTALGVPAEAFVEAMRDR